MNWHERFEAMKKGLPNDNGTKMTNAEIAEITGLTSNTVKNQTQPNCNVFPRWLKLSIVIFERLTKTKDQ